MQVHASSGAALGAVATPRAWRCCLTVQKSHMPVSVGAGALAYLAVLRPDPGARRANQVRALASVLRALKKVRVSRHLDGAASS